MYVDEKSAVSVNHEQLAEFGTLALSKSIGIHIMYDLKNGKNDRRDNTQIKRFQDLAFLTGSEFSFLSEMSSPASSQSVLDLVKYQNELGSKEVFLVANIDAVTGIEYKSYEWEFYVDMNVDELNVHVSSLKASDLKFSLFEEDRLVSSSRLEYVLNTTYTEFVRIKKPLGGKWRVKVNTSPGFGIKIYASSSR
jgi:hypothetical protein